MKRAAGLVVTLAIVAAAFSAYVLSYSAAAHQTCGRWLEVSRDESHPIHLLFMSWAEGWVGRAALEAEVPWGGDASAVRTWINNYCRAHPLNTIDDAAYDLEGQLDQRSAKPK